MNAVKSQLEVLVEHNTDLKEAVIKKTGHLLQTIPVESLSKQYSDSVDVEAAEATLAQQVNSNARLFMGSADISTPRMQELIDIIAQLQI